MAFVLDASVTACWAFDDEDHPDASLAFERMRTEEGVVPCLWWFEVRNILVANERRRRIAEADTASFLLNLSRLRLRADQSPGALSQLANGAKGFVDFRLTPVGFGHESCDAVSVPRDNQRRPPLDFVQELGKMRLGFRRLNLSHIINQSIRPVSLLHGISASGALVNIGDRTCGRSDIDKAVPKWDHGASRGCMSSAIRRFGISARSIRGPAMPWTTGIELPSGRRGPASPT